MATLTIEQRALLEVSRGEALRLVDPETNREYVLLLADDYDQLRSMATDLNARDFYPSLHRALENEGWNDPQMDEYNVYG